MTDPACNAPNCLADRQVNEAVLTTKMNIAIALSVLAVGLLSYSVFAQAPTIRAEMVKEINRVDAVDRETRSALDHLEQRVTALEKQ